MQQSQSKEIGGYRVVVTQYVPERQSPWFCKVFRTADEAEFSLQKEGYATADQAMAIGEAWTREHIAIQEHVARHGA